MWAVLLRVLVVSAWPIVSLHAEEIRLSYNPALGSRWETVVEDRHESANFTTTYRIVYRVFVQSRHGDGFRSTVTVVEDEITDDSKSQRIPFPSMKGLVLDCITDARGMILRLENTEEIKDRLWEIMKETMKEAGDHPSVPPVIRDRILSMLDQAPPSGMPDWLERNGQRMDRIPIAELSALLLGPDAAAAEALTRPLEPGVPQSYESRRSLGPRLPTGRHVGQFTLQSFDRNSGLAQIHWSERANPRDLQRAQEEASRRMGEMIKRHHPSRPLPDGIIPRQTETFEATAQVSLDDGVPRRVEYRAVSTSTIEQLSSTHTRTRVTRKLP